METDSNKAEFCEKAAPVGTRVIKCIYIERGGYSYPTKVEGKVIGYLGHVGADFHIYKVVFEAPIYEHDDSLVAEEFENNLFFPDGQSSEEQACKILENARVKK